MTEILHLVGKLNYYELQRIDPIEFPILVKSVNGRSENTDILTIFLDNDYTPKKLRKDLDRIWRGFEPHNENAYKLVDKNRTYGSWSPGLLEVIIFVLIACVFWICTFYTIMQMYTYSETGKIYRSNVTSSISSSLKLM